MTASFTNHDVLRHATSHSLKEHPRSIGMLVRGVLSLAMSQRCAVAEAFITSLILYDCDCLSYIAQGL